ncbi:MAG: SDR family NAD(P)-dependent oxidoreductase, partial [Myxococcota bacterium]
GGDPERWREILDVNVIALATCTSLAVDDMRRRGDAGHVVHVSSLSGHRVTRGGAMYAASKHAVRAMTEGLRGELRALASGIRVTAISPGNVATDFVARVFADYEPPPYPILEAKDVADAVAHVLAAPDHVAYHDLLMRPAQQVT